ncbi:oxysterol-binding protein-related protein 11-like isoform X2 [Neocloeon triangulifer]|uniref:oxysterol-binding protein-related protein 11-like isoform X2 n=1 Tax=Neocloeon triangulifer TaxID=2078957 RepID=UPI00286F9507|nr:oxysterol-binding protein-related protein 11-like isoform X2 [Neocloeon triangulifer]
MSVDKLRQQFRGQLYKYTNVVKGWQYRWFILDPERGILDYFVTDPQQQPNRKQRPRGSVHLASAVICPSDEDSSTFTLNSASGEIFKLQAIDARERQEWVNRLRAVAEMHTLAIAQSNPPLPPREHHSLGAPPQAPLVHCSLAVLDALRSARDNLQKAEQKNQELACFIDDLPPSGSIHHLDPELLMLKATSQATILCLSQCLTILQQQQIAPQGVPQPRTKKTPIHFIPPQPTDLMDKKSTSSAHSTSNSEPDNISTNKNPEKIQRDDELTDEEVEEDQNAILTDEHSTLLKLASHTKRGTDLTRVTLPTFLMEPKSLLEQLSNFFSCTSLFINIGNSKDAKGRMLAIVKWYLTSFNAGLKMRPGKKPLTPLVGETFVCSWKVLEGTKTHTIHFVAEQVQNQPPVSAFHVECPSKQLKLDGFASFKCIFTGMSVDITVSGGIRLNLDSFGEQYDLGYPTVHARSIISKPCIQLGGKVNIQSSTNEFSAVLNYPKSFFGEKPNQVIAEIKDATHNVIYKIVGDWTTSLKVVNLNEQNNSASPLEVLGLKTLPKRVRPIDKQGQYESRKLWGPVIKSLQEGDINKATNHRLLLVEQQGFQSQNYLPMYFKQTAGDQPMWCFQNCD